TNKAFTKNKKSVKVAGYSKVSKKITGLKAKTTYYVRVRTYKKIGRTTYYSPWSAVKNIKTK
ncbi:MAG: fibronectin type III domain-containing protein, partial [Firmicutes bacterium]|nr:fibronectin type III domain-containing protein [Bacillota bacterium]